MADNQPRPRAEKEDPGTKWEMRLTGDYAPDEVVSSLQKMIRRGREYEACYWAYILHQSGYGQYLWRRLTIITSEDLGNGDPQAAILVSSLQQSWLVLHKHDSKQNLDKFLLVIHAVLYLCRAKKSRENDSLCNLIDERFKSGERLGVEEVSLDSHCEGGRAVWGKFGAKDGKEKIRLDRWFSFNAYITNEAYKDKWVDQLKDLWYKRAEAGERPLLETPTNED
jgi:hypothetical protein